MALQGEAALRPYEEAARVHILQTTPADLVAGMSSAPPAEQTVFTMEVAEDLLANWHEALRVGADGYIDDNLALVKPWGFDVAEVAVPTRLWHGTEDDLVTQGEWLAAQIPGVVAHIEKGEGHASIGLANMDTILQELVDASAGRL